MQLYALGWGVVKRIPRELSRAKNTVTTYVGQGDWCAPAPAARVGFSEALRSRLAACFHRHHGNADDARPAPRRALPCASKRAPAS
jgi:hypothetical protein